MKDWINKTTPIIGVDGKPKGIQVIVMKDNRYDTYDVYRADNTDKFLGCYYSEKELKEAMKENHWYQLPKQEGDWFGKDWGKEGKNMGDFYSYP